MKSFQINENQLATISFSVIIILVDNPVIVGVTMLDLAKRFTFQLNYQKKNESTFGPFELRRG